MNKNAEDIDSRILFVLEKLREGHEIAKRQGFPSRRRSSESRYGRSEDSKVSEARWHEWARELDIDDVQLRAILGILENEGLLEKYEFVPNYV